MFGALWSRASNEAKKLSRRPQLLRFPESQWTDADTGRRYVGLDDLPAGHTLADSQWSLLVPAEFHAAAATVLAGETLDPKTRRKIRRDPRAADLRQGLRDDVPKARRHVRSRYPWKYSHGAIK
jgi:hypothetical protein